MSLLATIGMQPLQLCFNGLMIMALLLAVEAPMAQFPFIVNMLGGWPKKTDQLRKEGLHERIAANAQPSQPRWKLTNVLSIFTYREGRRA